MDNLFAIRPTLGGEGCINSQPLSPTWRVPQATEVAETAEAVLLPLDRYEQLSSAYLVDGASCDRIRPVQMMRGAPREYLYRYDVETSISHVSAPLALRIAGDAIIVSVLDLIEAQTKDRPVWARTVLLDLAEPVSPQRDLPVRVQLGHPIRGRGGRVSIMASFDLGEGACTGKLHIVC